VENNIYKLNSIKKLQEAAATLKNKADVAEHELNIEMLKWIRKKMPDGTIIDVNHKNLRKNKDTLPDYLRAVSICSGSARGTRIFRIERITHVNVNIDYPELSAWYADATPISEKTGFDMSGAAASGHPPPPQR
jgi:hypothetical protein